MRSFFSMCSALVAMKVWMRARAAPFSASAAREMSRSLARASEHTMVSRMALAMALHRVEVAVGRGREAGLDHIDAQALELARDAQLLVAVIEAPGDCSPSRNVVSKMISLSAMVCSRVA